MRNTIWRAAFLVVLASAAPAFSQSVADALEAFTGSRQMDGSAMIAYFEPLMKWLEEQNKGRKIGW